LHGDDEIEGEREKEESGGGEDEKQDKALRLLSRGFTTHVWSAADVVCGLWCAGGRRVWVEMGCCWANSLRRYPRLDALTCICLAGAGSCLSQLNANPGAANPLIRLMPIIADELLMRVLPTVCRYLVGREAGRRTSKQATYPPPLTMLPLPCPPWEFPLLLHILLLLALALAPR
jgi:hypothetical protein